MLTPWSHVTKFFRTPEVLSEMPRDNENEYDLEWRLLSEEIAQFYRLSYLRL